MGICPKVTEAVCDINHSFKLEKDERSVPFVLNGKAWGGLCVSEREYMLPGFYHTEDGGDLVYGPHESGPFTGFHNDRRVLFGICACPRCCRRSLGLCYSEEPFSCSSSFGQVLYSAQFPCLATMAMSVVRMG